MGFGENFQGMTDREILVEMAGDIRSVVAKVELIHCPRDDCHLHRIAIDDHETRLAEQERIEKERASKTVGRRELLMWGVALAVGSGIGSGLLLKLMGG